MTVQTDAVINDALIEMARNHYEKVGLGVEFVNNFIR